MLNAETLRQMNTTVRILLFCAHSWGQAIFGDGFDLYVQQPRNARGLNLIVLFGLAVLGRMSANVLLPFLVTSFSCMMCFRVFHQD